MADIDGRWLLGGGIGSGKSAVRTILGQMDVHTIDADSIGHAVLEPSGPAYVEVAERWPSTVVGGKVDRASLASIVFSNASELSELEAITHPHIFGTIMDRVEEIVGPVVVEIPLLGKAPPGEWSRLVVDCHDEVRLDRLEGRGMTREDARARMDSQPSRAEWLAVADLVVPNHDTLETLVETVAQLRPYL